MLHIQTYGPVTRIEMARTVTGRPLYRASAYLVDGLLIDSGPPSTGRELAAFARDRVVTQLVHTTATRITSAATGRSATC
jgi:hypothetical protein